MRKVNKIMLITVSMLLSLVLITSSVVSTTFAKYATTGQSSTSARVAKWGATIDVTLSEELVGKLSNKNYKDMAVIQFEQSSPLGMGAGKKYEDALSIKFDGKPEVSLKVKLVLDIVYTDGLKVASGTGGISADTHFIPMGIKMGAKNDGVDQFKSSFIAGPWFSGTNADNLKNNAQTAFNNGVASKIDAESKSTCVEKTFAPNTDILFTADEGGATVDELVFGFEWPETYTNPTNSYNYTDIGQYLLEKCANGGFGFSFTIIIEQIR